MAIVIAGTIAPINAARTTRASRTIVAAGMAFGMFAAGRPGWPLMVVNIDFAAIEPGAFFRIGQDLICGRHDLELPYSLGIARIEIAVVLLGQLAVGAADLVLAGVARNAKRCVWVFRNIPPLARSNVQAND